MVCSDAALGTPVRDPVTTSGCSSAALPMGGKPVHLNFWAAANTEYSRDKTPKLQHSMNTQVTIQAIVWLFVRRQEWQYLTAGEIHPGGIKKNLTSYWWTACGGGQWVAQPAVHLEALLGPAGDGGARLPLRRQLRRHRSIIRCDLLHLRPCGGARVEGKELGPTARHP